MASSLNELFDTIAGSICPVPLRSAPFDSRATLMHCYRNEGPCTGNADVLGGAVYVNLLEICIGVLFHVAAEVGKKSKNKNKKMIMPLIVYSIVLPHFA